MLKYIVPVVLAGIGYALFVDWSGFGIPCVFRLVTGWKCPGCGMTHMCIALLHLDFRAAFYSHPMMFVLLPVFGLIIGRNLVQYVSTGRRRISRFDEGVLYFCIALLILFSIVRNLVG